MPADAKFYFRAPYGGWTKDHARILNANAELRRYVGPRPEELAATPP